MSSQIRRLREHNEDHLQANPTDVLILVFQPPELWKNTVLLFQPPVVVFVMEALAHYYTEQG